MARDSLREKDRHKPVVRSIRRKKDGVIVKQNANLAARLVAKGAYVYADSGPDDSKRVASKQRSISTIEKTPSEVLHLSKIPELKATGDGDHFAGTQQTIRADDGMRASGTPTDNTPRADRKVRKASDIPKEKLDYIMKSNIANPAPAMTDKSAGSLKATMEKVRNRRK